MKEKNVIGKRLLGKLESTSFMKLYWEFVSEGNFDIIFMIVLTQVTKTNKMRTIKKVNTLI